MKKHIYTVSAFAVFAASALANPVSELDVKVPFAFKAGSSTLPAGDYKVTEATPGYLLIRGAKGGVFVPRSAVVVETADATKASFKFNRAGDKYVLEAVPDAK